ncbi:MAG: hypothetical protein ACK59M_08800 [Pseudomonadota bacterium]|jgi:hypothetical protein
MRLATHLLRSLVPLGLVGGLVLSAATQVEAAGGLGRQGRPLANLPPQGGVDAPQARAETGASRDDRNAAGTPPSRQIDWRTMLPAVTLRGRA